MIIVDVKWHRELERHEYPDGDLRVGGDREPRLPLEGLETHYCTLQSRAVGCLLVDVSGGKTLVNGKSITGPRALYKEDIVQIGDYELVIEHVATAIDPVEQRLVAEILAGECETRLVYADWLEENGDTRRAALLRLQEELAALEPGDFEYDDCARRLCHLATVIDHRWRMRLARGRVAGCDPVACVMDWGTLAETARPDIRRCDTCRSDVRYCEAVGDARTRVQRGERVVLDAGISHDPALFDITRVR